LLHFLTTGEAMKNRNDGHLELLTN
jgi:hypothetical protein